MNIEDLIKNNKEKFESELPANHQARFAMKLHLLDELDFVDIAEMMNVKASTVRSQYVRGLEKLRKSISKDVSHDTIKNK